MHEVSRALDEVKDLYKEVLGRPAPEVEQGAYLAFPPGVDPIHHAMGEVQQLKQLAEQWSAMPEPVQWVPRADTFITPRDFVLRLEVPGIPRDELKVLMDGGECVITGMRPQPEPEAELQPVNIEREWGRFERRFTLPPGSHPDKLKARYQEGILEIRVAIDARGTTKEMDVEMS